MTDFDVEHEPIYVFELDHTYVFKHFFELREVFRAISDYYDHDAYRFEVPATEWDDVAAILREYYYEPEFVEDVANFVVVKEAYTEHAEILKHSVANWSRRGYNFFLMAEPLWVERSIEEHDATPASETDLAVGL